MMNTANICFPPTLVDQIFALVEHPKASRIDLEVAEPEPLPAVVAVPEARVEPEEPPWKEAFAAVRQEQRLSV